MGWIISRQREDQSHAKTVIGKEAAGTLSRQDRGMFDCFCGLNHVHDFVFRCGYRLGSTWYLGSTLSPGRLSDISVLWNRLFQKTKQNKTKNIKILLGVPGQILKVRGSFSLSQNNSSVSVSNHMKQIFPTNEEKGPKRLKRRFVNLKCE